MEIQNLHSWGISPGLLVPSHIKIRHLGNNVPKLFLPKGKYENVQTKWVLWSWLKAQKLLRHRKLLKTYLWRHFRSEALPVSHLHANLQSKRSPDDAHSNPHRRKTFRLWYLWKKVREVKSTLLKSNSNWTKNLMSSGLRISKCCLQICRKQKFA